MTAVNLVLCEGRTDQAALAGFATECAHWALFDGRFHALPNELRDYYPRPTQNAAGWWRHNNLPVFLRRGAGDWLEIRPMGSDAELLSDNCKLHLQSRLRTLDSVGFVVDANSKGIAKRVEELRDAHKRHLPGMSNVAHGEVHGTHPRVGVWVACKPDGSGSMDDLLIEAAMKQRPSLTDAAIRFVEQTELSEARYKSKIAATIVLQADQPGGGLSIRPDHFGNWFDAGLDASPSFGSLKTFLGRLAAKTNEVR